jgi:thioredoxin-dependent peroxiredoxin
MLVNRHKLGHTNPPPSSPKGRIMRHSLLLTAAAMTLSSPAFAALPEGAKAPDFATAAALGGKAFEFSLAKALKKGPVVLYFFPAAFTPGCTVEAHEFAEAAADFKKAGASLLGVAGDDIAKLSKFSVEECRNKFPVGVASAAMIKGYDVALPMAGRSNRTSFVIAPNGQIVHAYTNSDYRGHVAGALKAVQGWRSAQKKR